MIKTSPELGRADARRCSPRSDAAPGQSGRGAPRAYGRLLDGARAARGCVILFVMMVIICADVLLRNIRRPRPAARPGVEQRDLREPAALPHDAARRAVAAAPGRSTSASTSCCACCRAQAGVVLRVGRATSLGLRLLRASSRCTATRRRGRSFADGALSIKTLVTPEWWSLAPLPICVHAAGHRDAVPHAPARARADARPRNDAVSSA